MRDASNHLLIAGYVRVGWIVLSSATHGVWKRFQWFPMKINPQIGHTCSSFGSVYGACISIVSLLGASGINDNAEKHQNYLIRDPRSTDPNLHCKQPVEGSQVKSVSKRRRRKYSTVPTSGATWALEHDTNKARHPRSPRCFVPLSFSS